MSSALEQILDPRGTAPDVGGRRLAPRDGTLSGKTIGLLNNSKPNAGVVLERLGEVLAQRYGARTVPMRAKPSFAVPAADAQLGELVAECDVVVTGVGDCGSCSAATTADGVLLEGLGVPAVALITDIFQPSSAAMASLKGFPGYRVVALPHPIASLDQPAIDAAVDAALPEVLDVLGVAR